MSQLIHSVMDFVARVRQRPTLGSEPGELAALEKAARSSWGDAFAAQHVPVAPLSWEAKTILASGQERTERVPLEFPGSNGFEVVGFYVSLSTRPDPGALKVPTKDDIDVQVDINTTHNLTQSVASMAPTSASRDALVVSLGAMDILAPRLMGLRLEGPRPVIGFSFKWKWGPGFYADTQIGMTGLVRRLTERDMVYR